MVYGPGPIVYGLNDPATLTMKKNIAAIILVFATFAVARISSAETEINTLQLRVDPAYFSPDGDGLQDQTFFYPVLKSQAEGSRWTLDISEAKRHRRIVRLSGARCPALIKWSGNDKKDQIVPDGAYVAKLTVSGKRSEVVAEQTVVVDRKPPQVTLSLSTAVFDKSFLANGAIAMTPRVFDDSPVERWIVQVLDQTGRTVTVMSSSGPVHDVAWDGTDRNTSVLVPQGRYRVAFQAWDKAGNQSAPYFANLTVNVSAREMLEHSLHEIQVNETPMGLIVQLDSKNLFVARKNKIELSDPGKDTLREVAILLNAYPAATVKLDGYSHQKKTASLDQQQASLFAWRIYSYLSKAGNVKASRVTVRGRGRSAMFDRRSVSVPLTKNGVEVILEGSGPW